MTDRLETRRPERRTGAAPILRDKALLLLLGVVVAAPFPLGSLEPIWLALWILLLSIAIGLADTARLRAIHWALAAPMIVASLAYAAVLVLQSFGTGEMFAPYELARDARRIVGPGEALHWMPRGDAGVGWAGPAIASFAAFIAGLVIGSNGDAAQRLLKAAAWAAVGYVAFGIVMALIDPRMVLWYQRQDGFSRLSGTFINANTAATWFALGAIVFAAIAFEEIRLRIPNDVEKIGIMLKLGLADPPQRLIIAAVGFAITAGGCFLTVSRAGAAAMAVGLLIVFVVSFRRHFGSGLMLVVGLIAAGLIGLVGLDLLGLRIGDRFVERGVIDVGRIEIFQSTWAMILDHPLFGVGAGAFETVFPTYRNDVLGLGSIVNRAHSVPLQIASDVGLPVAIACVLAYAWMLAVIARGAVLRRSGRLVPIAALGIMVATALHSLVDFSLQIPGFAIPFWALTGAALAQSVRPETPGKSGA